MENDISWICIGFCTDISPITENRMENEMNTPIYIGAHYGDSHQSLQDQQKKSVPHRVQLDTKTLNPIHPQYPF